VFGARNSEPSGPEASSPPRCSSSTRFLLWTAHVRAPNAGTTPTDGWELRWSSRAELSSPGSELIVTRSPGRRASAPQSRPAPGPVSSGRPLVCGLVRSRRKPDKLQASLGNAGRTGLSGDRSGDIPEPPVALEPQCAVPAQVPPKDRATQASALRRVDWKLLQYVRSCGKFQPCLSLRETSGHTLAKTGSSQTAHRHSNEFSRLGLAP
jgi:hypothetical protein